MPWALLLLVAGLVALGFGLARLVQSRIDRRVDDGIKRRLGS